MSRSLRCVRSWLRFMTGMIATAMDIASRASKPPAAMSTWDRIGIRRLLMGLARKQLFPGAHLLQGSPNCGYSNRIVLKDAPRSAGMILRAHRRAIAHGDGDQQGPAAPDPAGPCPEAGRPRRGRLPGPPGREHVAQKLRADRQEDEDQQEAGEQAGVAHRRSFPTRASLEERWVTPGTPETLRSSQ